MPSLRDQVRSHRERIGRLIRQDEALGGTSKKVNANFTKQLPLTLSHESVSRASQKIDFADCLGTHGYGSYCLYAS